MKAIKIVGKYCNFDDVVNEVEVLKELYHPNLLRYFRSGFCKKKFIFIVMECCESNLEQFLKKETENPLTFEMKSNVFKQICEGLYYLHEGNDFNVNIFFLFHKKK